MGNEDLWGPRVWQFNDYKMKIGKNSIQGVFRWSPTVVPEPGDIVLHNGTLWSVLDRVPTGEPGHSESYREYGFPGMITDPGELREILSSPIGQWPDKAIPVSMIPTVFGTVFHGLSRTGLSETLPNIGLSKILSDTNHPTGVYRVSRKAEGIRGLFREDLTDPVYIRKYVTREGIVLEALDYVDGVMWTRLDSKSVPGNWRLVTPGQDIKKVLESVIVRYKELAGALTETASWLSDNFRWTRIPGKSGSRVVITSDPVKRPNLKELDYTVTVICPAKESGISRSFSLTFPGNSDYTFQVTNGVKLEVSHSATEMVLSISGNGAVIGGVYYQDFYEKH